MKRHRVKKPFLEKLREGNNISTACTAVNISRETLRRWKDKDSEFATAVDQACNDGDDLFNDLAENRVKQFVNNGDKGMTKYWLNRRHPKFKMEKHPIVPTETDRPIAKPITEIKPRTMRVPLTVVERMAEHDVERAQARLADVRRRIANGETHADCPVDPPPDRITGDP